LGWVEGGEGGLGCRGGGKKGQGLGGERGRTE